MMCSRCDMFTALRGSLCLWCFAEATARMPPADVFPLSDNPIMTPITEHVRQVPEAAELLP